MVDGWWRCELQVEEGRVSRCPIEAVGRRRRHALGEERKARDEDEDDAPRVPERERQVDEEDVADRLGAVVRRERVVRRADDRREEEREDEGDDVVARHPDVDLRA